MKIENFFNLTYLANIISTFPISFVFTYLLLGSITRKYSLFLLIIAISLSTDICVFLIKRLPYPKEWTWTLRPKQSRDTDMLSSNGKSAIDAPGFPSGHMSFCTIFSLMIIILHYHYTEEPNFYEYTKKYWLLLCFMLFIVISTAWARYYKKVHNIIQIIGGIFFGILVVNLFYHLYFKKKYN